MSRAMIWLSIVGLMIALTAMFSVLTDSSNGGMTQGTTAEGQAMVIMQRERNGHFTADGSINGTPLKFLVDTGATDIAISERTARSLGLKFGPRISVMTAAGPAPAWVTRLDRVEIGGLVRRNVRATITPGLGDENLLGMSFLKHFSLRQEGDQLILATGSGS